MPLIILLLVGCGSPKTTSNQPTATPTSPSSGNLNESKNNTNQISSPSITQIDPNTRYKTSVRQTSGVIFLTPGSSFQIDAEGSPGGKFDVGGLKFTQNCRITVGEDYTIFINKVGLVVTDTKKKKWESQKFLLDGKEMIAFFPKL